MNYSKLSTLELQPFIRVLNKELRINYSRINSEYRSNGKSIYYHELQSNVMKIKKQLQEINNLIKHRSFSVNVFRFSAQ